MANHG